MDSNIKKYIGAVILLIVIGGAVYTFFYKKEETMNITYSTSDAGNLKGEVSIALDSWIGYFPLRSPVFGQLMRDEGYRIKIIDDKADYPARMNMLHKGETDFAVCTVDSYLLNGSARKYPATVIAVIDESKGGDAILAWKDKFPNIDKLKTTQNFKIAYTPASPSEHLIKSISVHFGIDLNENKDWRVEVNGAEEAYDKLISKDVDIAVLWEPHVTEALADKNIVKLLGSEDVEKLIVDILLVNRKFANNNPEIVKLFLRKYFDALETYKALPNKLIKDITAHINSSEKQVNYMLKGVKWIYYPDNIIWFGLNSSTSHAVPELIESIESTVRILIDAGDFDSNPLTHKDPYTIVNSSYIRDLYDTMGLDKASTTVLSDTSMIKRFKKLSEKEWGQQNIVGALKLRPITFRSGTSVLDSNGVNQVKEIVNNIKHYPNFRILIKGHSGVRGDQKANLALSLSRANSVRNELQHSYNIDPNRIRVIGMGSREPLARIENESDRSYSNRLKRVEIVFLSDK